MDKMPELEETDNMKIRDKNIKKRLQKPFHTDSMVNKRNRSQEEKDKLRGSRSLMSFRKTEIYIKQAEIYKEIEKNKNNRMKKLIISIIITIQNKNTTLILTIK